VVLLVGLAAHQQGQQTWRPCRLLQVIDLLLVMVVNEGLDGGNRAIHGPSASQRGQCAGQPARHTPGSKQYAALGWREPAFDLSQVLRFGVSMLLGKGQQFVVAAPARHGGDASVNEHGACLAGVVRAQLAAQVL
jgi:hypothetical protein